MLVAKLRSSNLLILLPIVGLVVGGLLFESGLPAWLWVPLIVLGFTAPFVVALVSLMSDNRSHLHRVFRGLGVRRIPFALSFEHRDPELGMIFDRIWRGFESVNIACIDEFIDSAATPRPRQADALLSRANWSLAIGDIRSSVVTIEELVSKDRLRLTPRQRVEAAMILAEARARTDTNDESELLQLSDRLRIRRARRRSRREVVLNNLRVPFDPSVAINHLLGSRRFQPVGFVNGEFVALFNNTTKNAADPGALVSVVIPAFNAQATLINAIDSALGQSWPNIEVIVVDDASTDQTANVASQKYSSDPRVRIVVQASNLGPYEARNLGAVQAKGDFITVLDADDWMHPDRIKLQVQHLLRHRDKVANRTSLVRVSSRGMIVRRGAVFGDFVGPNTASLMFRRSTLDDIGYWDPIRAGSDSEMVGRLRTRFGKDAVVDLERTTPLTIARSSGSSLTADHATGIRSLGWDNGARQLYRQAFEDWHRRTRPEALKLETLGAGGRQFISPPALLHRERPRKLDVVLVSDFSLPGGTTSSNIEEIKANRRAGLKTGIIHNRAPHLRYLPMNPKILDLHAQDLVLATAGEAIDCDVLVIKYPPSAIEFPDQFPEISVRGDIVVAVNQAPWTGYSGDRREVYRIGEVDKSIRERFGKSPFWAPIGPAIREVLLENHSEDVRQVRLASRDWYEIIDPIEWQSERVPQSNGPFRIGRHARDSVWKWPATREDLLAAYPPDRELQVSILGGADVPRRLIGRLPQNWQVRPFDSTAPRDYLHELDALVYFPHPDMTEAFGRTILEAMASGLPVITDERFESLFGEGVIPVKPTHVTEVIERLRRDPSYYRSMSQVALVVATERFGYESHVERLRRHGLRH